eukprot:m.634349 g.634349  ORF g.634349 m.634349 type:complete len:163 (-) comp22581_c0_seq31:2423-2911(-)
MLLPNGWCDIVSHTTMAANADVYFRGPRVDRASMRHAASQRQPHGTRDGDTSAVPHLNHYASRRSSWTGGLYDPTSGVQTTLNPLFQADPESSQDRGYGHGSSHHEPSHHAHRQHQQHAHGDLSYHPHGHDGGPAHPQGDPTRQQSVRASEMRVNIPAPDYD